MTCSLEAHGLQLNPQPGDHLPCGLCGAELYQAPFLIECSCCTAVFGVTVPTKWVGDGWVVDPSDRAIVAAEVRPHFETFHPERLSS